MFVGRESVVAGLKNELESPDNSVIVLTGQRGVGKTALIHAVLADRPHVIHSASPLPGDVHLVELAEALQEWSSPFGQPTALMTGSLVGRRKRLPPDGPVSRWEALLDAIEYHLDEGRAVAPEALPSPVATLVIDDAAYLADSHQAFGPALAAFLTRMTARGNRLKVILSGSSSTAFDRMTGAGSVLASHVTYRLRLCPLSFRHAAHFYPAFSPADRIRAYAIFGGLPSTLGLIQDRRPLGANVRQLILEEGAALRKLPLTLLHANFQSVGRYAAVISALANGARRWGEILEQAVDFPSGGQMTPYIQRLEALGLIDCQRSLDDEPESRNRRYQIVDPLLRFWFRFVLPSRRQLEMGGSATVWEKRIRPALDAFVGQAFPIICRQYLANYSHELFGIRARMVGSIWSSDRRGEIPIAGTLEGGAVCYGIAHWDAEEADLPALDALRLAIRHTRYGVARMARNQIIFSRSGFSAALRARAASDEAVRLVELDHIVGETLND